MVMSISFGCLAEEKALPELTYEIIKVFPGQFGDTIPVYGFHAKNLPVNKKFKFIATNLNGPMHLGEGVVEKDGRLKFDGKESLYLEGIEMCCGSFMPGETILYSLVSSDEKITINSLPVIPNPLETFGSDGVCMGLLMATRNAKEYMLIMEKFTPFEKCTVNYFSCDKTKSYQVEINENGKQLITLNPLSFWWFNGGTSKVEVVRSNKEKLSLTFDWGKAAYAAHEEKKRQGREALSNQSTIAGNAQENTGVTQ